MCRRGSYLECKMSVKVSLKSQEVKLKVKNCFNSKLPNYKCLNNKTCRILSKKWTHLHISARVKCVFFANVLCTCKQKEVNETFVLEDKLLNP